MENISRNHHPSIRSTALFLTIAAALCCADIWSKNAVFKAMAEKHSSLTVVIKGFFNIVAYENSGAAWSSFQGQRVLLLSISAIAIIVLAAVFLLGKIRGKLAFTAAVLFGGGILGNLYDRIFNEGRVRDFLDFYITWAGKEHHWPAFNLADSFLCIAAGLILLYSLTDGNKNNKSKDDVPKQLDS